jgi:hypothetical protein
LRTFLLKIPKRDQLYLAWPVNTQNWRGEFYFALCPRTSSVASLFMRTFLLKIPTRDQLLHLTWPVNTKTCRGEFYVTLCPRTSSSITQQPLMSQDLLIVKASWSHSVRHTSLGNIPLDEWSARRRDLYLTTHNNHKRQTSMPRRDSNLQPERPQTNVLDCAATEIGCIRELQNVNYMEQNWPLFIFA